MMFSIRKWLFGEWPEFRIIRRGFTYAIISRFGRTVARGPGPYSIQWAMRELEKPSNVLEFRPRAKPKELWQERIDFIDAKCKEMGRRVAEGRI